MRIISLFITTVQYRSHILLTESFAADVLAVPS